MVIGDVSSRFITSTWSVFKLISALIVVRGPITMVSGAGVNVTVSWLEPRVHVCCMSVLHRVHVIQDESLIVVVVFGGFPLESASFSSASASAGFVRPSAS